LDLGNDRCYNNLTGGALKIKKTGFYVLVFFIPDINYVYKIFLLLY
jgi:hypothetical protein